MHTALVTIVYTTTCLLFVLWRNERNHGHKSFCGYYPTKNGDRSFAKSKLLSFDKNKENANNRRQIASSSETCLTVIRVPWKPQFNKSASFGFSPTVYQLQGTDAHKLLNRSCLADGPPSRDRSPVKSVKIAWFCDKLSLLPSKIEPLSNLIKVSFSI